MPLGGFFVYQQKLNFYILVFWGLFGTIAGSMPWYYLGKLVNEKKLSNFLDKRGKYIVKPVLILNLIYFFIKFFLRILKRNIS